MVYDLGGGTFDVSVIEQQEEILEVRASHGNVHLGGDDFDERILQHLLAHLSSTEASLPAVVRSTSQPPRDGAAPFDPNRWNASQVRKRAETDSQELLNEFDMGTTQLVDALTDLDMDKPVTVGAFPGYTVRDAMAEMLEHQTHHLDDLRAALHAHPER